MYVQYINQAELIRALSNDNIDITDSCDFTKCMLVNKTNEYYVNHKAS